MALKVTPSVSPALDAREQLQHLLHDLIVTRTQSEPGSKTPVSSISLEAIDYTMDLAALAESANQLNVQWWPYFDLVHCILGCLSVRKELKDYKSFSRNHPLSLYLSCMLTIFAGGLICNPLLGEPVLGALKNQQMVLMATIVWYLTFYCPFDLYYKICKLFPVEVVMYVMKEIYRAKKVTGGVALGAKVFPGNYLIMILIGTIKGNGSAFMKIIAGLFRGNWGHSSFEAFKPSFQTKGCLLAAVIYMLEQYTTYLTINHTLVCLAVGSFFVYSKLVALFKIHDPVIPFESTFCYIFCGGFLDSLDGESEKIQSEIKKNE